MFADISPVEQSDKMSPVFQYEMQATYQGQIPSTELTRVSFTCMYKVFLLKK